MLDAMDLTASGSSGSSTNPHPGSYLATRLARDGLPSANSGLKCHPKNRPEQPAESSTNPHPEGYLETRLAQVNGSPTTQLPLSQSAQQPSNPRAPQLQDIPVNLPSVDIRVVVVPSANNSPGYGTGQGVEPYRPPQNSADVLVVHQTSKTAGFNLTFSDHAFHFIYDVWSDDLVIRNLSNGVYEVEPVNTDDNVEQRPSEQLKPFGFCALDPGPWRMVSNKGAILSEFLLLHRRYVSEKHALRPNAPGSKRKDAPLTIDGPNQTPNKDSRSIIVFNNPSQLTVVKTGNPMVNLEPGESIAVRPVHQTSDTSNLDACQSRELVPEAPQDGAETYVISHLRDIAANKGLASVFRGKHSVHGDVVVKVIRRKTAPPPSYIAKLARDWQNEERFLRKINHPSIIKFFGSDSRFYSIYMEYSPDTDLAAYRDQFGGKYFVGTTEDAERIFRDMASALAYLQDESILHNDIKPGNILYGKTRGPVLIDFGLASACGSPVCNGGTPWYVPDEYATRNERGPKSDIFALGVTMLYVLRKIPLPEMTEPGWQIARVADPAHGDIMTAWAEKAHKGI